MTSPVPSASRFASKYFTTSCSSASEKGVCGSAPILQLCTFLSLKKHQGRFSGFGSTGDQQQLAAVQELYAPLGQSAGIRRGPDGGQDGSAQGPQHGNQLRAQTVLGATAWMLLHLSRRQRSVRMLGMSLGWRKEASLKGHAEPVAESRSASSVACEASTEQGTLGNSSDPEIRERRKQQTYLLGVLR